MARQTRSQRRARREAQQASTQAAPRPRAAAAATAGRPAPARARTEERRIPGSGAMNFVAESWGELKKVEWPGQKQLIQGVVVVLVACVVVGVFLYSSDLVFKRVVENLFLR
jgi:preprotein translocase subunit SecE